ncbi:putative RNA-directed DNA polymerase from transposon X-element [Nephila pilipes]|uniref:Putative RNA-directed DNA polymerase from transposon X-element n=1 Tax=Nephila pilipes TaxID=299642 RepID=A0A8X6UBV2_NEPPI|nr:putative RNA-directed DNA polymerase from transposon X-element [Nephila pilipes]
MSVESLRVKQKSLRSSFTMCCTSIEEALEKDTTLTDLYALQRQIMDKFTRLDTVQEHILELLLSDDLVSSEYEEDFTKAEKYHDKMNQLSAELENTDPTSEGLDSGRTLDRLTFLRKEVESEEMILLARTGLGSPQRQKSKATVEEPFLATSAALINTKGGRSGKQKFCLFCSQCNHWSSDCLIGKKLSLNDKKSILITNRACFRCLNKGHNARSCRLKMLKCMNCDDKSHHTLLCNKNEEFDLKNETVGATISNSLANQSLITNVYLQTIVLKLCYNNNEMFLHCLLDNGSQKSYLTQRVLSEIKEKSILVPDLCNSVNEIDMLLGADVISVILSGRTIKLKSGLIAIGTMLGFTLMELDVVPLDADAPKIPSSNVDVSESTMIPVDAPPNMPKFSRYGRTIRRPKRLDVFNITIVFESE